MSDLPEESPTQEPAEASPELAASDRPEAGGSAAAAAADDSPKSTVAAEPAEIEAAAEPAEAEAAASAELEPEALAEEPVEAAESAEAQAPASTESEAEAAAEPAEAETAASTEPEPEAASEPVETTEPIEAEAVASTEPEAAAEPIEAEAAASAEPQPVPASEPVEAEVAASESASGATADASPGSSEAARETTEAVASEAASEEADNRAAVSSSDVGSAMSELETALAEKRSVKGQVIGWNKGGYHVAVGKIAAFCPVSQIEIGNPRGPKRYLDKTFSFRIIEIQDGGRRVVLSRADAIRADREQRAALVRELLEPGAEIEGKVRSLTDFGAFVDLGGGIEGLVHVSEISRRRVEHPKEALKTGQKVKVSVLKIEKGGQRISLSMKRLEPDPWKGVADRHPAGSEFTGTILRQTDFGLFVEVDPGLEGLVHTTRLDLGMTLEDERLQVGNEISGWVHEVEPRRRRLSLSLRQVAGGNPWQGVGDRYPVGEVVKGKVERLASFGAFIELEPGLTGLLPFSLLGSAGSNPRRQYHAGKEVSVRVLSIDRAKRRISLGTESSKAEGNQQDYRDYKKAQRRSSAGGMNAMEAAFAKLKDQRRVIRD